MTQGGTGNYSDMQIIELLNLWHRFVTLANRLRPDAESP